MAERKLVDMALYHLMGACPTYDTNAIYVLTIYGVGATAPNGASTLSKPISKVSDIDKMDWSSDIQEAANVCLQRLQSRPPSQSFIYAIVCERHYRLVIKISTS
jgi:hypothetical protein